MPASVGGIKGGTVDGFPEGTHLRAGYAFISISRSF